MKILQFTIVLLTLTFNVSAQNRLVLNNDAYIVMENSAKVVLDNGNANAIQTLGSGGNIVTTSENEEIIWNIGVQTGIYTIPWTTNASPFVKIPLEMNITGAGFSAGRIVFSTYGTPSTNLPLPTGVTNLFSGPSITDNSLKVIDRFGGIDARGYSTKPSVTLKFDYSSAEWASPNTIVEPNLQAQRWNSTSGTWEDLLFGSQSGNSVQNADISSANFFKNWTLVDNTFPLPVELVDFNAVKNNKNEVEVSWKTVSEINNDYFEVEKSQDGVNFTSFVQIEGAGNSQNELDYATLDRNPFSGISYYRLKQVDFDGHFSYSEIKAVEIDTDVQVVLFPNPTENVLNVSTSTNRETIVFYQIVDLTGSIIYSNEFSVESGKQISVIDVNELKPGVYFIQLSSDNINKSIQFIKQ